MDANFLTVTVASHTPPPFSRGGDRDEITGVVTGVGGGAAFEPTSSTNNDRSRVKRYQTVRSPFSEAAGGQGGIEARGQQISICAYFLRQNRENNAESQKFYVVFPVS